MNMNHKNIASNSENLEKTSVLSETIKLNVIEEEAKTFVEPDQVYQIESIR